MGRLISFLYQLDDFSLVHFVPLDYSDEENINDVLIQIDMTIQYGEDMEPKEMRVCLCIILITNMRVFFNSYFYLHLQCSHQN